MNKQNYVFNTYDSEYLEHYLEVRIETFRELWDELQEKQGIGKQHWTLIPASKIVRVWNSFASLGFLREVDEQAIGDFQTIICRNIAKLEINTAIMGHATQTEHDHLWDELYEMYDIERPSDEEMDKLTEICEHDGQWALSDYGLGPLQTLLAGLLREPDFEKKLVFIDRILNVVHCRSDLCGLFIEGGTKTLNELSGVDDLASVPKLKTCGTINGVRSFLDYGE